MHVILVTKVVLNFNACFLPRLLFRVFFNTLPYSVDKIFLPLQLLIFIFLPLVAPLGCEIFSRKLY